MATDNVPPFEPSSSWCYRFSRYRAIPEILTMPEVTEGKPFKLLDLSKKVLDAHLTKAQQEQTYLRKNTGAPMSVAASVKFYIPYLAEATEQLVKLGGGMFRIPTDADLDQEAVETAAIDAATDDSPEEGSDLAGWIYAFTFPLIERTDGPFPIKVGKTSGDVAKRVAFQCRQSASFEPAKVLKSWKVKRVGPAELAVHNVLKARGRWRETAPGTEWFDTTVDEVESIVTFLNG